MLNVWGTYRTKGRKRSREEGSHGMCDETGARLLFFSQPIRIENKKTKTQDHREVFKPWTVVEKLRPSARQTSDGNCD